VEVDWHAARLALSVSIAHEAQRAQQRIAQTSAQEAYDLAASRYRGGLGSYVQVLAAESQVLARKRLDADLSVRRLALSIALVQASGGGFEPGDIPLVETARVGHAIEEKERG
jgi:outer membrane protein TolC